MNSSRNSREPRQCAWEDVKGKIQFQLINKEQNAECLKECLYKDYLDLAAVFMVEVLELKENKVLIPVTEMMASEWGVSIDELWETALGNPEKEECTIMDIRHFVPEEFREEADKAQAYVCRMKKGNHGAQAILRRGLLKGFAEKYKEKIYILPSSVFETILVVDDGKTDENVLKLMVEEINGEWKEKAPEEWLSDSVYYYDKENDEIKIAA